jgi:two-component system, OmpR family, phosphate regulon response regulator PhoB
MTTPEMESSSSLPSILVVEDDRDIQTLLVFALSQAGFQVYTTRTVSEALAHTQQHLPSAIILDWMLPQGSGIQLAQRWRNQANTAKIPILFLTARQEESDKLLAFEQGADDYLTKPFSIKELVARVGALLRRSQNTHASEPKDIYTAGHLRLDVSMHKVCLGTLTIAMNPTEFKLLLFFMTHRERVYSRTQILDLVWGYNTALEERTVDVHIRRLRKAFEPYHIENTIETVRGIGYRFNADTLITCSLS